MVIIGKITKKIVGSILIFFVGLMILLMIVSDVGRIFPFFTNKHYTLGGEIIVGRAANQPITRTTYQFLIDQYINYMHANTKQRVDNESMKYIQKEVWKELVGKILYQKECSIANIKVGTSELIDIVQGEHIAPLIQSLPFFKNKETGQFDKKNVIEYLQKTVSHSKERQMEWSRIEEEVVKKRCQEKLDMLIKKSLCKTTLEKKQKQHLKETVLNLKYLYIPYSAIKDEVVHITDDQLITYLKNNKDQYQQPQTRSIKYIIFPILPSMEDESALQEELKKLEISFKASQDPHTFAKDHTDGNTDAVLCNFSPNKLPKCLADKSNLQQGMVIGPVKTGSTLYKLYRIVAIQEKTEQKQDDKNYEVAVIEKKLIPSDMTRDHIFKQVACAVTQVKDIPTLAACATKHHVKIKEATLTKDAEWIGDVHAREVVRWLYNDASIGSISQIFEINDQYMIATMSNADKAGLIPLASIKEKILKKVCNQEKAKIIVNKLKEIRSTDLEDIAEKYGEGVQIGEVNKLKFMQDRFEKIGTTNNVIGLAFSLENGQQSTPIVDEQGVFINTLISQEKEHVEKKNRKPLDPQTQAWLKQIKSNFKHENNQKSMEEIAKVEDYRYKFY